MAYGYSKSQTRAPARRSTAAPRYAPKTPRRAPARRPPTARINTDAQRVGVFKIVTSCGSNVKKDKFTLDSMVNGTHATESGLTAMLGLYEEWKPLSLTMQLIPRANELGSSVVAVGCDLNQNKTGDTLLADLISHYSAPVMSMAGGKPVVKKITYNQSKHQWLSCATSDPGASFASTILIGFSADDDHIPCDVVLTFSAAFKGYGSQRNTA